MEPEPGGRRVEPEPGRRASVDPLAREVGYGDLRRALQGRGCPICRAAGSAARRYIEAVLWEFVNDPGTRTRLRASHGFCRAHAGLAVRVADERAEAQGLAILYEDFLSHAGRDAAELVRGSGSRRAGGRRRRPTRPLAPAARCPACETAERTADNCLRLLGRAGEDTRIGRSARSEGRGLCVPHLAQGLGSAEGDAAAERLLAVFERGNAEVLADLREFVRKHDHRYAHEPRGREGDSWRRGPRWMAGIPLDEA